MLWLVLAIVSRLFWASTNFCEQILSRNLEQQGVFAPIVTTWVLGLPFVLIAWVLSGFAPWSLHMMMFCGLAVVAVFLGLLPYFYCLRKEPAQNVIPYLELTPVFLILLAALFKQQYLTVTQGIGVALIVVSSFLFSWDFREAKFKIPIVTMLSFSSFGFAVYFYSIAEAEVEAPVWATASCFYFCEFVLGVILLSCSSKLRQGLLAACVADKRQTLCLGLIANCLEFCAFVSVLGAFAHAPSYGHVAALSGLQSIFCFFLAIPLGKWLPEYFTKIQFNREQVIKLSLIVTICAGVYLLAQ